MQSFTLQVLWLDNSLGLSINQETKNGNIPLTPYYFWPVSEAWEQIKIELESKPWISVKERIELLNLIVEVMNKWQTNRTNFQINNLTTPKPNKTQKILTVGLT